jgi:hypothetical protein
MEFVVTKEDFENTINVCEIFSTYGVLRVKSFFSIDDILSVRKELLKYYDKTPPNTNVAFGLLGIGKHGDYECGQALRIANNYFKRFPNTTALVSKEDSLNHFLNHFFPPPNKKLLQIFSTYDYIKIKETEMPRNAWLHFDPYEAIKYAVMLQDTDQSNGCLFVIPKSQSEGKYIRESLMEHKVTYKGGLSHRFVDYRDKIKSNYSEQDIVFVDTKIGDLLILNTDCWHGGGIIQEEGKERIAIYYHNRR